MPEMINPFDSAGYTIGYMTEAINILPNTYGRINELGLFVPRPVTTTAVIVERQSRVLNLLPTVRRGGPATKGNRSNRDMRAFVVPHIPHDDEVLPEDLQGIREFGSEDGLMRLETLMTDKLTTMRTKHGQTLEYMRLNALKGVLKDGAGVTIYDWHAEFGFTKKVVDFVLGTASTDVDKKIMEVSRHMEDNLTGEVMSGIQALVSPSFFDKLISHPNVRAAYSQYASRQEPLREDVRRRFVHKGMVFEEYNASFTLADETTVERAIADDYGIAFPLGTRETFRTYYAPANFLETVNRPGTTEVYAKQILRPDGRAIDLLSESNPLPMVRRPNMLVEIRTSN